MAAKKPKRYLTDKEFENFMDEWHKEKNDELKLDPAKLTHGSEKKAYWICRVITCLHIWMTVIKSRTVSKSGCPECSKRNAAKKLSTASREDSVGESHPHLFDELNDKTNLYEVYPNSTLKCEWKCIACEHIWFARVADRKNGSGCPKCVNRVRIAPQEKSVGVKYKYLVKEINDGTDLETIYPGSNLMYGWKCITCGHEWFAAMYSRVAGNGCPSCANRLKIAPREKSAGTVCKTLISEINDGTDLYTFYPGSGRICEWKCRICSYIWKASIFNKIKSKKCRNCPSKLKAAPREKSAGFWHPELLNEIDDDTDLYSVYQHSNKMCKWKCTDCPYRWSAKINDRSRGYGCFKCAHKRIGKIHSIAPRDKSFGTLRKQYLNEWIDERDPFSIYPNSAIEINWKCHACSKEFLATPHSRRKGGGCPQCNEPHLERITRLYLTSKNIQFKQEFHIELLPTRRYDFYFVHDGIKCLVECDGKQHFDYAEYFFKTIERFQYKQEVDRLKTFAALASGYKIIRIDHKNVNNIHEHIEAALKSRSQFYFSDPEMYRYIYDDELSTDFIEEFCPDLLNYTLPVITEEDVLKQNVEYKTLSNSFKELSVEDKQIS